jgi:hypothetical protein
MMSKRTKIFTAAVVTVLVLSIVVAVEQFPRGDQSVPKPFVHALRIYPNNGTAMQAQNLTIKVEAVFLEGQPEPVTFLASGGPNGSIYQFTNQTGTPTKNQPFTSNLTISIPPSTVSGTYTVNVASIASTQTSHAPFNLTVLNAEIQVTGTVTIDSKVTLNGATLDVIPTDILFKSNTTGETYQAKVHRFTDTTHAPGKTGNYSIMLPNQQSYHVEFYCLSFPHYIPVLRIATGGIENGYFTVSCRPDVDSIGANFTG